MSKLSDSALALIRNGYEITPIREQSKAPLLQNWPEYPIVDEETLKKHWRTKDFNIGIICGKRLEDGTCLIAIDIDIDDGWFIQSAAKAIGQKSPAKRGAKGITYFVRYTHPFDTVRRKKGKFTVEILGNKTQTVVPPSVHPNGMEYVWIEGSLEETPIEDLPKIDEWAIDEIFSLLLGQSNAKIAALNDMEWRGVGGGGDTHDISLAAVAAMVSRNWPDDRIYDRINRAKKEACERVGDKYDWPEAHTTIYGWIRSAREKGFTGTSNKKRKEIAPDEFVTKFILVRDTNQLVDKESYEQFGQDKFNSTYLSELDQPWAAVLRNSILRSVRSFTYKPQQPGDVVVKEESPDSGDMIECFNLYRPPPLLPSSGSVDLFLDHINMLFPEEHIAQHILHWLAYLVQRPGEKIMHSLLIQGGQGIGKSFLAYAMGRVLGRHNVGVVDHSETAGGYTGWMRGKQLVVIEEVLGQRRMEFMNHLKALITADRIRINEKYVSVYEIPNRANLILLTNYKYSMVLDEDDRRFFVAHSPVDPKKIDRKYFDKLWGWMATDKGAAALMQHFNDKEIYKVDGENFDANKAPPVTKEKVEVIGTSKPDVEQYIIDQYHAKGWPMACDLISISHLFFAVQSKFRGAYYNQIQQAIVALGGRKLKARKLIGNERVTLYAMKDYDTYNKMRNTDIERHYRRPLPMRPEDSEGYYDKKPHDGPVMGQVAEGDEF